MIGIVIVSHSRALAEAAVALASEMVNEAQLPPLAVAAGLDELQFGTDAVAVAEAIGQVDGSDGVLVLLDLGSAVLSTEMALELLAPETATRVTVSSAPLVEGLVAAVVTAAGGATLAAVVEEARQGLAAKQAHLDEKPAEAPAGAGRSAGDAETASAKDGSGLAAEAEIEVKNPHGLHARPAAKLVATVRAFDARVTLSNPTAASRTPSSAQASANAVSLSQVATLNVRRGDRLLVRAIGPDADDAVAAVVALADRSFDDDPQPASPETAGEPAKPAESGQAPNREKLRSGSGLDFAIGAATLCDLEPDTRAYQPADRETEGQRSAAASAAVQAALTQVREQTERDLGPAEAAIFDAHLSLLADPALEEAVASDLQSGSSALDAWTERLSEVATRFEHLEDAYQRERAQDVRSLQRRMAFALTAPDDASAASAFPANTAAKAPSARDRGILVVPELDPATAATLDLEQVVGIVTRQGGATGHGVIVARSRGIPILTDAGEQVDGIAEGTVIAFDASTRRLWVKPDR
ncbi:MAG: dihydroxyacetone kinase phosphoryl donor subunit DhaM [Nocardioidaceae bacterium]